MDRKLVREIPGRVPEYRIPEDASHRFLYSTLVGSEQVLFPRGKLLEGKITINSCTPIKFNLSP